MRYCTQGTYRPKKLEHAHCFGHRDCWRGKDRRGGCGREVAKFAVRGSLEAVKYAEKLSIRFLAQEEEQAPSEAFGKVGRLLLRLLAALSVSIRDEKASCGA